MKFTTPCFIRKNTHELHKKLEELGYQLSDHVKGRYTKEIYCYNGFCFSHKPMDCSNDNLIDCEDNEALFLAIAALREDSDIHQYFTCGQWWEKSKFDCSQSRARSVGSWHKATVEELVLFKDRLVCIA